jgi:hypothetical protein
MITSNLPADTAHAFLAEVAPVTRGDLHNPSASPEEPWRAE